MPPDSDDRPNETASDQPPAEPTGLPIAGDPATEQSNPPDPGTPEAAPTGDKPRRRRRRRRRKPPAPGPETAPSEGGDHASLAAPGEPPGQPSQSPPATEHTNDGAPARPRRRRRRKAPPQAGVEAAPASGERQDRAAASPAPPRNAPGQNRGPRPIGRGPRDRPPRDGAPRADAVPRGPGGGDKRASRQRQRGTGNLQHGGGHKPQPERRLHSFESVVDRGFEDVPDEANEGAVRRVDWTIVKRTVADQASARPMSVIYVLQRDGNETEFPHLGAARSAANKTIVHPEKLTRSKEDHAASKKK